MAALPHMVRVDALAPDPAALAAAGARLRTGGLVAFPTETVYGLGAHALDPLAVARIFAAKGRPASNPLIVHVACMQDAIKLTCEFSAAARALAEAFWPGPLTLVLPRSAQVPDCVTAGGPTVALRVPAHPVALALVRAAGVPVAAPSANRYQQLSPTTAAHVAGGLGAAVDLILDGGPCAWGLESTVVDVERGFVLRAGPITLMQLTRVLPSMQMLLASAASPVTHAQEAPRAPGQAARHYAPRTPLRLVDASSAASRPARAGRIAWLGCVAAAEALGTHAASSFAEQRVLGSDPVAYAAQLFAALHELDAQSFTEIWVQVVPAGDAWGAVRDRLARAAHPTS